MPTHPPLHHLPLSLTTYLHASKLQSILFHRHLLQKALLSISKSTLLQDFDPRKNTPPPYLLTAQFHPVYTLGRRQQLSDPPETIADILKERKAQLVYTPRGGEITFHGPGQVVAYPIIDLKAHGLTPKCYIRFLENSIIGSLGRYGVEGFTTEEAGVWTRSDRKIASVGVNLRRWVSSHGVAVNVDGDMGFFKVIKACGLEGVEMWSVKQELEEMAAKAGSAGKTEEEKVPTAGEVEDVLVKEIAEGLGCDGVKTITEEEVVDIGREFRVDGMDDGVELVEDLNLVGTWAVGRKVMRELSDERKKKHEGEGM
ncbi:Octanoyltransferase [Dactylella cylindrospora]|nr:Octanoyltransferase [Dactylella cylindrospora]